MQNIRKRYLGIPLLNFLFAAILGLFMRYAYVKSLPIPYRYRFITHAHSHIAILGWIYLALFALFIASFLPKWYKKYNNIFWFTQISIVGMLLSFPFQGYAAASITFSTLHVIVSYFFFFFFFKNTRLISTPSYIFLLFSILSLFILIMYYLKLSLF